MRKTTEEWVELLHTYDSDKQTIKGYCAEHDIAVSSFCKYCSRLQQKQPSNGFIHAEITSRISTQDALPVKVKFSDSGNSYESGIKKFVLPYLTV